MKLYTNTSIALCALPLLLLVGCPGFGDEESASTLTEVPANPNYEEHVSLIAAQYCNKCHSASSANGAPDGFRLDVCEDSGEPGAQALASRFAARINNAGSPMPPAGEPIKPGDIDKQTVQLWFDQGAPCAPGEVVDNDTGVADMGGGDTGGMDADNGNRYIDEVLPVLQANTCLDEGCHGDGAFQSANLNLSTEAGAIPMIVRCEPDGSILVQKLREDTLVSGSLMPLSSNGPVSDADLDIIRGWITDGADMPGSCGNTSNGTEDTGVADTGMGGMDTAPDMPAMGILHPTYDDFQMLVTNYGCTDATCHNNNDMAGGLDLRNADSIAANSIVVDCQPENSILFQKLRTETVMSGSRMPLNRDSISENDIATIRNWIADGADAMFNPDACP